MCQNIIREDIFMADNFIFSSESVTEGHPDKVADQISDGVLDAILAEDPMGRSVNGICCDCRRDYDKGTY